MMIGDEGMDLNLGVVHGIRLGCESNRLAFSMAGASKGLQHTPTNWLPPSLTDIKLAQYSPSGIIVFLFCGPLHEACLEMPLMKQILHDLVYTMLLEFPGFWYSRSCRVCISYRSASFRKLWLSSRRPKDDPSWGPNPKEPGHPDKAYSAPIVTSTPLVVCTGP